MSLLSSRKLLVAPLLSAFLSPVQAQQVAAGSSEASESTRLENVVVLGTRRENVTELSSQAPIDIFSSRQLQETGASNLNQALQELAPSFQYNVTAGSDGVATVRPAALRGK